jgi:Fe-S-cluster containining protein
MRSPKDTRWACQSCTACCRGFQFGPVEPTVIAKLVETDVPSWWPPAADQDWFQQRRAPEADSTYYFTSVDGHCIFLRDDGLCSIHATHGKDAKPGFCREFPYHIVEERQGAVGVIRAECEGWHRSFIEGPRIQDKLEAVRALPRVVPHRRFTEPTIMLFPRSAISLEHWEHIEAEFLCCLEERPRGIEGDLHELRHIICTLARLTPLEPTQADYLMTATQLLKPLEQTLAVVLAIPHGDPHQEAFTRTSLKRVQNTIAHLETKPLPAPKPMEPEFFNQVLQNWLLGKRFLEVGPLSAGLGSFALGTLVARCCAAENADLGAVATHYAAWLRFTGIPTVQHTLFASLPALHHLFMNAAIRR